ncbi:MAG: type II toxin-antitoxin system HicA family toxin [Jaaginema sp. PMC 1079.18]|nr:type II toxin-antitoxin system HicA family toxin [Jaaginema sp. PMC 1080.18]MEC4849429.1 type II toxin-antitoxin system HicA family toxin [Jaaginema sp. PMC 1079.18]MEC4864939.1 type II toxin-antitoxin system HicA family toxin [Jaaginema sp. PMC 1078.18]
MGKYEKLLQKILTGTSDKSIKFDELRQLLKRLGFDERVKGDHYIFTKDNVEEIINIQPKGSEAKSYQIKQVRNLILKYRLGDSDVSEI